VPSFLQWISSDRPKKYRIYVIFGEDATLRADALDRVVSLTKAQEQVFHHFGDGETSAARVWDSVTTQPMPGINRRLVVVHHADRMHSWGQLKTFIEGASVYPETILTLILDRPTLGKRVRNREKSLPGSPVFETTYADWEQWLKDYTSAAVIACSPLSIDQADRTKPSQVVRWLSLRLPVTQAQAAYLWGRVGGSSVRARDAVRALSLIGVTDASNLAMSQFTGFVDSVVGKHGAEELVEHILFDRRAEAISSVVHQSFDRTDWSRILGLLSQRLDWLGGLHGALATNEKLDQVMRRLSIPRHMILHYAHREDVTHNIARKFNPTRVSKCRRVLADFDSTLNTGRGVPPGFGEALITAW
jgi:hypothetical protein